jgi:hypothetical protein
MTPRVKAARRLSASASENVDEKRFDASKRGPRRRVSLQTSRANVAPILLALEVYGARRPVRPVVGLAERVAGADDPEHAPPGSHDAVAVQTRTGVIDAHAVLAG